MLLIDNDDGQINALKERLQQLNLDNEYKSPGRHCQAPRMSNFGGSLKGQYGYTFHDSTTDVPSFEDLAAAAKVGLTYFPIFYYYLIH